MVNKWEFPNGKNLTPYGVNNAGINSFLDNQIESLAREIIQNSLDAKDSTSENPVEVSFEVKDFETDLLPGVSEIRDVALKNAIRFWEKKNNESTLDYLYNFKNIIESPRLKILKVSDYNTCGLDENSYDALVLGNGYSEKQNENSAGSKGIGKAAPFANSDLRLVFYNSVSKNGDIKHVGVLNFVSFNPNEEDENIITQERALYYSDELKYIPGQINFGFRERREDQYGTDLYILALRNYNETWENKILLSIVNNFLISIIEGKLIVRVNSRVLSSDNIESVIDSLKELKLTLDEKRVFENTQNYYDAFTSADRLEFNLDEEFVTKYPFIEEHTDAKLILLKRENANRAILQTRISGMKIYDRKGISGNINFTGVFRATGAKLDKFLKALENTNHDKWSADQLIKNNGQANEFLIDLYKWFKRRVQESYANISDDIVDAIGLSDFLPMFSKEDGTSKNLKEKGIKNRIEEVSVKRGASESISSQLSNNEERELRRLINEVLDDSDSGTTTETGSGTSTGTGSGTSTGTGSGTSTGTGSGMLIDTDFDTENKLASIDSDVIVKSIVLNSDIGKYKFILKPKKSKKLIELKFLYIGEDGTLTKAEIINSTSETNKVITKKSGIQIEDLRKGDLISLEVEFNTNLLIKMEVKIYEVES